MPPRELPTRRRWFGIAGALAALWILGRLPPTFPEGCDGPACLADLTNEPNTQ